MVQNIFPLNFNFFYNFFYNFKNININIKQVFKPEKVALNNFVVYWLNYWHTLINQMFSISLFQISYFTKIEIKLMLCPGPIYDLCFLQTFINILKYFNVTCLPLFTPISLTNTFEIRTKSPELGQSDKSNNHLNIGS